MPESVTLTVTEDEQMPVMFQNGSCEDNQFNVTSLDIMSVNVTSSVLSNRVVKFLFDGEEEIPDCVPDGSCPDELRCNVSRVHDTSNPVIFASIIYDDEIKWDFCISLGRYII